MDRRTLLGLAGILAFLVAVAELFAIRVVPATPDEALLTIVGIVPLGIAYLLVRKRLGSTAARRSTPEPERLLDVGTPGDDFGGALATLTGSRGRYGVAGSRWALRDVAASVMTRFGTETPEAARERVEAGSWTDNPVAASFVGDPRMPLVTRARTFLSGESTVERGIRETVDEIMRLAGLEPPATERPRGVSGVVESLRQEEDPEPTGPVPTRVTDGGLRPTGHWEGIAALALLCAGIGVLARSPGVVLTGVVGIGLTALARAGGSPAVDLDLDRSVSDVAPAPGDSVGVTVTVRNRSGRFAPDVRIVDGVPPGLEVSDGSPRVGTALRPGEAHEFSYEVEARRGHHEFGPALALVADLPGSVERETTLEAPTSLTARPRPTPLQAPYPVRRQATRYAGRMSTGQSGDGTEFFGTREYRPGDPLGRIDWNRRARTGEFATLEFRAERAARVLLIVDARSGAYLSPDAHGEHAVDRSADAAGRLFETLVADGHRVGLATLAPDPCWIEPAAGDALHRRVVDALGSHPSLSASPPTETTYTRRWLASLRGRIATDVQPILCSPLCDETVANLASTLEAAGYAVTVVSPDPTADRTPGHRLARLGRHLRVADLRRAGIPVVDWGWDEPLATALSRHAEVR